MKVTKLSGDGREKILELFGPGSFVGEMSLLDDSPRSATVKTLADRASWRSRAATSWACSGAVPISRWR